MAELRYNPLLDDWTMVNAHRAKRPDMPKDWCPFDANSGKVPEDYDVLLYPNDFPILSTTPPEQDPVGSEFYKTAPSYGKCDVVLYSPGHYTQLHELSDEHVLKLVKLWRDRFEELRQDENIKYIFPFENRGKEVGTTMPHPHGQIYSYAKMPLRLRLELEQARKHYEKSDKQETLYERILKEEQNFQERVIFESDYFSVVLPFFCEYPFGCYILPKKHVPYLAACSEDMLLDFARVLKTLCGTFDLVYDRPFPYMMGIYQAPVNSEETYPEAEKYYGFHVKFFPPLRAENAVKWCASSETAAWVHGNPRKVEECAVELKAAYQRYQERKNIKDSEYLLRLSKEDLIKQLKRRFFYRYGFEGQAFFSPARINLIGEHIDYNGGMVLPAAIELGSFGVAFPNGIDKVRLKSYNEKEEEKIALDDLAFKKERGWMNYVTGMLKVLQEEGYQIGGLDILVFGNVPVGSGLSSSASLELLIGTMQNHFYNQGKIPMEKLCLMGQRVENEHMGLMSGIMDQYAIGLGKKGKALLLNTSSRKYQYVPVEMKGAELLILNSNKLRALAESKYNERCEECEEARQVINTYLAKLAKEGKLPKGQKEKIAYLCDLQEGLLDEVLADLRAMEDKEKGDKLARRVEHVIRENLRVYAMIEAMEKGEVDKMGKLLNASHTSLSKLYEVAGTDLDALVEACQAHASCLGARMIGAGFGGCAIALIVEGKAKEFIPFVQEQYKEKTGRHTDIYASVIEDGPRALED